MSWIYFFSRFLLKCWCLLWHRVSQTGAENIPEEGALVFAANHASHLDPVLMGTMTRRRVCYVARSTLGRVPLVGLWMRAVGIVFVDRAAPGKEAMARAIGKLQEGEAIGMFPEGTRTRDGRLQGFERGLLLLLKKSQARVVPVGIRGSFRALPPGSLFPRPSRCSVHFGRVYTAAEVLAEGGLEALRQDVAALSDSEMVES